MAGQIVNQPRTDTPGTPVVVLNVNTTPKATTGTSEEVLATYTLPANTLSADGKAIRVRAFGKHAANANVATLQIRAGGIGGSVIATCTANVSNGQWVMDVIYIRTGASAEIAGSLVFGSTGAGNALPGTQNTANAIDIVVTGATPTSAGDVTFIGMIVEALN